MLTDLPPLLDAQTAGAVDDGLPPSAPAAVLQYDPDMRCSLATGAGLSVLARGPEELVGRTLAESIPREIAEALTRGVQDALGGQESYRRVEAGTAWIEIHAIPVRAGGRGSYNALCVLRDITSQVSVQNRIRRSEGMILSAHKMEAVARLAGGVAHEFNNLLTGIRGYTRLLLDEKPWGHPDRDPLVKINRAVERASGLVAQLLAFGRQEISQPRVVDLAKVVPESEDILRSLLGEEIVLDVDHLETSHVRVDPRQLEQVLVNLAMNARDAMPGGGMVRLAVERARFDEGDGSSRTWAVITFADTGRGMSDEVLERIFEPFFSTRSEGRALGLGLSAVHGMVEDQGGRITVESEEGRGTTFRILLPVQHDMSRGPTAPSAEERSDGSILVVDDDAAVREVAARILRRLGYDVTEASGGPEALRMLEERATPPDLLLTDVVMPEMNGRELSEQVQERYPGVRILFMSAYTEDEVILRGIRVAEVSFLPKPFSLESLADAVRGVLA